MGVNVSRSVGYTAFKQHSTEYDVPNILLHVHMVNGNPKVGTDG